jgi:hypothetical protein
MLYEKYLKSIGFRFPVPLFGKEGAGEICRGGSWRLVFFHRDAEGAEFGKLLCSRYSAENVGWVEVP